MIRGALLALILCVAPAAWSADGRVVKVLPQLLDKKGRHALSPSLFERDAYQAQLRKHPENVAGLRFAIQWKAPSEVTGDLTLKLEMKASKANGNGVKPVIKEIPIKPSRWGRTWTVIEIRDKEYEEIGEVMAWRASLLQANQEVAQMASFLW